MKKLHIKVLSLSLFFLFSFISLSTTGVKVFANDVNKQPVNVAQKLIVDFYENKDLGKKNDLKKYIESNNLLDILNDKANLHQYVTKQSALEKINYKITPTLIEEKTANSNYYLKFAVKVEFNYADLEKVDSCYGEEVEIILNEENGNYTVLDFYSRDNYYDSFVRGDKLNLVNGYENLQSYLKNNENLINIIKDKQNALREKIDLINEQEKNQPSVINHTNSIMALSSLNKAAIVNWARSNYFKSPPSSGNGVVPYYDFSQIPDAYDCTNFASHALLAGGATVYNTGNQSTGWYYVSLSNRSYSWSGVPNLHDFITTNTTKGPVGTSFSYYIFDERYGYPYVQGDILQFNNGSVWRHSTIVTGFYPYSGSYYFGALVTGGSGSGAYNDNTKAEDIYAGYSKRVITLTGNYQ